MAEITYSHNISADISFYKQNKNASIQIVLKPTDLGKVFGGTGSGVATVAYLSGIIKGTFYYNNVADLTGDYKYTVTCTTDSNKKVFCSVNAEKEETVGGTVKHYYWKFVASDAFGKDEFGKEDDVETLKNEFSNSDEWMQL